jgi:hypothetical protein
MDRSMALNSTAAASELMRPPANASMTFVRSMAGKSKGRSVSCSWPVWLAWLCGPGAYDTHFHKCNQGLMRHLRNRGKSVGKLRIRRAGFEP